MINLDEPICSRFWLTFGLTQSQTAHSKPGKALYFPLRVKPWQARQVWTFCDKHKPKFIFQMFKARLQHCWVIEYFFRLENHCSWPRWDISQAQNSYCFDILYICSLLCIVMFKNCQNGTIAHLDNKWWQPEKSVWTCDKVIASVQAFVRLPWIMGKSSLDLLHVGSLHANILAGTQLNITYSKYQPIFSCVCLHSFVMQTQGWSQGHQALNVYRVMNDYTAQTAH